ncbi:hypothetical protein FRB99_006031 [Tulasnella sp. 403]|nr:hypothetical protein FRB99_006031 [Tulasnella sp. 403]
MRLVLVFALLSFLLNISVASDAVTSDDRGGILGDRSPSFEVQGIMNCPNLVSLTFGKTKRKVLGVIHDLHLKRCFYSLEWDKKLTVLAWSSFGDLPADTWKSEVAVWKKLGMLKGTMRVAPGRPWADASFLAVKYDTDVQNPESYFGQAWNAQKFSEPLDDDELSGDAFSNKVLDELEPSGRGRKGRVKTEGYESDSTDDGEGVVASRKKSRRKADDDEDDVDMFGGGEKDGSDADDAPKKKKTKYMNLGDIDGQEFGGGQASDDESGEDEPEDEDDAARRAKKGMGYELSSFNMKDEMEEGKFAEDGTFVRSFDPHQMHDRWMEGLTDKEIKKARRSRKKIEEKERERKKKGEEDGLTGKTKEELQKELLNWVKPGESVLQTLARLGAEKKKAGSSAKSKSRSAKSTLDPSADTSQTPPKGPVAHPENADIDRVTALASTLLSLGETHVYDETHRTLLFSVKEAGLVPRDWVPPLAAPVPVEHAPKYHYRWSPEYLATTLGGAKPDEVFGPYSKEELLAWKDASYFGPSGERVQLRRLGEDVWSDWSIVM